MIFDKYSDYISWKNKYLTDIEAISDLAWREKICSYIFDDLSDEKYVIDKYKKSIQKGTEDFLIANYERYRKSVRLAKSVRQLCEKKGRDYLIWFDEYLAKENYLGRREEQLASMKKNYNRICKSYNTRNGISPDIEIQLMDIIRKKPGILQTQIYDEFDIELKSYISNKLSILSKSGKIVREKKGNTYSLTICE